MYSESQNAAQWALFDAVNMKYNILSRVVFSPTIHPTALLPIWFRARHEQAWSWASGKKLTAGAVSKLAVQNLYYVIFMCNVFLKHWTPQLNAISNCTLYRWVAHWPHHVDSSMRVASVTVLPSSTAGDLNDGIVACSENVVEGIRGRVWENWKYDAFFISFRYSISQDLQSLCYAQALLALEVILNFYSNFQHSYRQFAQPNLRILTWCVAENREPNTDHPTLAERCL